MHELFAEVGSLCILRENFHLTRGRRRSSLECYVESLAIGWAKGGRQTMDLRIKQMQKIRVVPRAQRGLHALVDRAPQAEAFGERVTERLRPATTWLYNSRRRLATLGVAMLTGWLFLHVMFGANGMVVYRQKRAGYQSLRHEIDLLQKESEHYTEQINALQTDPKTIEKEAREQLHYTRPGEVVYVAPAPPPIQIPSTNAAQK
jgi:cell division protein FtsB